MSHNIEACKCVRSYICKAFMLGNISLEAMLIILSYNLSSLSKWCHSWHTKCSDMPMLLGGSRLTCLGHDVANFGIV